MLPARRHRNRFNCVELSLVISLGATSVAAQTTGANAAGAAALPNRQAPGTAAATTPAPATTPASATTPAPATSLPGATETASSRDEAQVPAEPLTPHSLDTSADSELQLDLRKEPLSKPPETARWLLIGTGLGTTALWYAGAYGIRELWPSQADRSDLKVPIAGPFMDLAHTGCPAAQPNCSTFQLVVRTILVSLDAIGQAGGIALVLQGAVLGTASVEAPRSNQAASLRRSVPTTKVMPVPWLEGNHGGGIGLVGRF